MEDKNKKRSNYISWDEYFMGIAMLAAKRSKDPNTQVGACIVSQDNIIISTGYNGMPKGCSDDEYPWERDGEQTKYPYVVHAELNAVLNANYMRVKLAEKFTMAYDEICMHEFVMSLVDLHKETGVSALDLAKGMLDYGLHPPTMYFPLIVHEALMVEPCETESKETMDEVCDIYGRLFDLAYSDPDALHTAPHDTPVRRLDEVGAARNMILRYSFAQ